MGVFCGFFFGVRGQQSRYVTILGNLMERYDGCCVPCYPPTRLQWAGGDLPGVVPPMGGHRDRQNHDGVEAALQCVGSKEDWCWLQGCLILQALPSHMRVMTNAAICKEELVR